MACRGTCCASFPYSATPEQLRERWAKWPSTSRACRDDLYIAAMLVPLGERTYEQIETYNADSDIHLDILAAAEGGTPLYTCRHWDHDTKLCTSYENRPKMCADYPYDTSCEHGCGYKSPVHVQVRWMGHRIGQARRDSMNHKLLLPGTRKAPTVVSDQAGA